METVKLGSVSASNKASRGGIRRGSGEVFTKRRDADFGERFLSSTVDGEKELRS